MYYVNYRVKWHWLTYNLTPHKERHSGIVTFGFLLSSSFCKQNNVARENLILNFFLTKFAINQLEFCRTKSIVYLQRPLQYLDPRIDFMLSF